MHAPPPLSLVKYFLRCRYPRILRNFKCEFESYCCSDLLKLMDEFKDPSNVPK